MQDAYFVDQQNIGTWTQIGYKEPASNNFTYTGKDATSGDTWIATAKFSTDDCNSNAWKINTTKVGTNVKYQATDNCPALTPNFKNIGTSGSGS